jgi:hypothetical protein
VAVVGFESVGHRNSLAEVKTGGYSTGIWGRVKAGFSGNESSKSNH